MYTPSYGLIPYQLPWIIGCPKHAKNRIAVDRLFPNHHEGSQFLSYGMASQSINARKHAAIYGRILLVRNRNKGWDVVCQFRGTSSMKCFVPEEISRGGRSSWFYLLRETLRIKMSLVPSMILFSLGFKNRGLFSIQALTR